MNDEEKPTPNCPIKRASFAWSPVSDWKNSRVPDLAMVPMLFTTSSRDMPMPLSDTVRVRACLSSAAEAFETSSLRKISLLPYKEWIMRLRSCLTSAWKPRVSLVAAVLIACLPLVTAPIWGWIPGGSRPAGPRPGLRFSNSTQFRNSLSLRGRTSMLRMFFHSGCRRQESGRARGTSVRRGAVRCKRLRFPQVYRPGRGILPHLDRQHLPVHRDAGHLLGVGEGPAQALFLRQHPARGFGVRVSRRPEGDSQGPGRRRRRLCDLLPCRKDQPDGGPRDGARFPGRAAVADRARLALQRREFRAPQRALRLSRRLWGDGPAPHPADRPGPAHSRLALSLLCVPQEAVFPRAQFL